MKIFSNSTSISADHLTPVAAFRKLRDQFRTASIFESSDYSDRSKSKSFIVLDPLISLKVYGNRLEITQDNSVRCQAITNYEAIENVMDQFDFQNENLKPLNGFFGAISYDAIPLFEKIDFKSKSRFLDIPDGELSIFKFIIVFDNFKNEVEIIQNDLLPDPKDFNAVLPHLQAVFSGRSAFSCRGEMAAEQTENEFINNVERAKVNIEKGDVFQLVLSRSFQQGFEGDDFEVYRSLRSLNPSPYMFYYDFAKAKLIGASPEAHLIIRNKRAEIHPIAGTYKKTGDRLKDKALKNELFHDAKENAEHNMLVDLARNDLNYSCIGVEVNEFKVIQEFSHVFHMVSKVNGELTENKRLKAFAKTFPAGTLSGAPKFKAMQLIDVYEKENRGYYGGVIGHFAANGDLNVAIIIRSALSYKGFLHFQAGAGIVYDSDPSQELQEVYNKTNAIVQAIDKANKIC